VASIILVFLDWIYFGEGRSSVARSLPRKHHPQQDGHEREGVTHKLHGRECQLDGYDGIHKLASD